MKYDALTVMEDIVATQTSRLEIDVPGEGGRGWSRTESSIEVGDDATLDEQWRQDICSGARHLREESYVRVSEPHYDAKVTNKEAYPEPDKTHLVNLRGYA